MMRRVGLIMDAAAAVDDRPGDAGMRRLRRLVRERTGLDLAPYKGRFLERRVAIRQRATRHERFGDYLELPRPRVRRRWTASLRCLTIHVSAFFRNPSTFDAIRRRGPPAPLRARAARGACASGASAARAARSPTASRSSCASTSARRARDWDVQIHAIDVDDRVLEEAKAAEYGPAQVAGVGTDLLARYFTRRGALAPRRRRCGGWCASTAATS